ncbi:acetyl-CoA acetyltransferase [Humitalea rosea]|uniref:Acetyl-CoA acetyltransferase n=1 Tax=Humitalea rosea TaxID=990373 RepID=A0A2W7HXV2_9PROT|nr:thiolase family protein [Humitalea rosea]PZW38898.1 acetyl-CoA acetyltransferase [Humitalea rosea]
MHPLRDTCAIVGVGASAQGKVPGSSAISLSVEAFKRALDDSGLRKEEIDGLLTLPGQTSAEGALNYLRLGETLGIDPRFTGTMNMGGATPGVMLQHAVLAVNAGMAKNVAFVFGDAAATGGGKYDRAQGWGDSSSIWGYMSAAANSAITAARHMAVYGTTSRQLGEIAVACRYHASLNPDAVMRTPITVEDHQASRWVVEPLHLLDCCLVSDGGVCVIVSSAERARDLKQKPVLISGMGQAYTTQNLGREDWWYAPHQRTSVLDAYAMAGVGPRDIDVVQLYDNFTISVMLWLEHAGFCKPGEAGPFCEGGRIQLGGELPVNTAGGNLSESYMEGCLHIVEAVRQLRGQCGPRQVRDAEVSLVTGRGQALNCANALVLRKG